jgi:sugar (pentulose or hexulose) kinase
MVPCIAIFDIGKTNKKFLLFDQHYQILKEEENNLPEILDDDGDPCENIAALIQWIRSTWNNLENDLQYDVLAVNFTTYGASLVHLGDNYEVVTPLYNYLKKLPEHIEEQFYNTYGDKIKLAVQTSSPPLGMLNSGLQLYWLKYQKPESFKLIKYSLHLPQFISFLFTGNVVSEYSSIGCHTLLWDFEKHDYHEWVYKENLNILLAPLHSHDRPISISFREKKIYAGIGLHDSSSALIPYLKQYKNPFLLLSTGTWGITLNPFAQNPLIYDEVKNDCLQYLTYRGKVVKASRTFIGHAHEVHTQALAQYFQKPSDHYKHILFNKKFLENESNSPPINFKVVNRSKRSSLSDISFSPDKFLNYEAAYHQLMFQLACAQAEALFLASEGHFDHFTHLLVDGGFSRNPVFMEILKILFPNLQLKAGKSAQGTSLGAALILGDVFSIRDKK